MSFSMNVDFNKERDVWIFTLKGDLDIYTCDKFKVEVLKAFESKKADLEIDGMDLDYVDSTGLGVLIGILKEVRETDNKIYITNVKPNIRKIFDITELDKLFIFRGEDNE